MPSMSKAMPMLQSMSLYHIFILMSTLIRGHVALIRYILSFRVDKKHVRAGVNSFKSSRLGEAKSDLPGFDESRVGGDAYHRGY